MSTNTSASEMTATSGTQALASPATALRQLEVRKPRALIVDDETSVLRGCVVTLKLDGWEAVGEYLPKEALKRLSVSNEHYDVLVLDYAMPELDGLGFAAALDLTARPPILLASAYADGAVALAALRLGIWDFLAKPLMPDELRRRVRQLYTRAKDADAATHGIARALHYCNRCAWAEALEAIDATPEAERVESTHLVTGLLYQILGNSTEAEHAFKRANWWPRWHEQGVEIWNELARRLA